MNLFDPKFYSEIYKDLKGLTDLKLMRHYLKYGHQEDRLPSAKYFETLYPTVDLPGHMKKHKVSKSAAMLQIHQSSIPPEGKSEEQKFDAEYYMQQYPDVVAAGFYTPELALQHWLSHGQAEGRVGFDKKQKLVGKQDMLSYYRNAVASYTTIHDKQRNIIHVRNPYQPKFENDSRRIKFAIDTTITSVEKTRHNVCFTEHHDAEDNLPLVNEFIQTGVNKCVNDNDIVIITNFDICLTDDCYDRVVEACNTHECTFSFRRDFNGELTTPLTKEQLLKQTQWYVGADLFAFTKNWWVTNVNELPTGQLLGRPTWDWVFRLQMARSTRDINVWSEELEKQGQSVETPGIIYHEKHDSFWEKPSNHTIPSNVRNVALAYNWMCDKSNIEEFTYKKIIEKDYGKDNLERYLKHYINASVAIVGITRNNESQLHTGIDNMIDIGSMFNRFKIFLYENDSVDGTKKILEEYKQKYPDRFNYMCGKSPYPPLPGKYQQMGYARQQCANWVKQLHQIYDHVIIIDPDIRIPVEREGVLNTFETKNPASWHAVFANGIYNSHGMMWDAFAFRTGTYGHVYTPELFKSNKLHEKDGTGRILPVNKWTPVHSAFGGLGIYKRECFEIGNYDLTVNDCEHVGFHQSLRRNGLKKLFVNPHMIKKYSTDETNLSGYSTEGLFYTPL